MATVKLKQGVRICTGRKSFEGEIPAKVLAAITARMDAKVKAAYLEKFTEVKDKPKVKKADE